MSEMLVDEEFHEWTHDRNNMEIPASEIVGLIQKLPPYAVNARLVIDCDPGVDYDCPVVDGISVKLVYSRREWPEETARREAAEKIAAQRAEERAKRQKQAEAEYDLRLLRDLLAKYGPPPNSP